jgi:hypothetical protein
MWHRFSQAAQIPVHTNFSVGTGQQGILIHPRSILRLSDTLTRGNIATRGVSEPDNPGFFGFERGVKRCLR